MRSRNHSHFSSSLPYSFRQCNPAGGWFSANLLCAGWLVMGMKMSMKMIMGMRSKTDLLYLNCIQNKFFNSNLFIWQIFHDIHSCFVHKIFHQNIIYFKDRSSVNLVRLQYNFRVCTIRFLVKSTSTSITSIVGHVVVGEDFTPQIFAPRHFSRLFFSCVSETKTLYL